MSFPTRLLSITILIVIALAQEEPGECIVTDGRTGACVASDAFVKGDFWVPPEEPTDETQPQHEISIPTNDVGSVETKDAVNEEDEDDDDDDDEEEEDDEEEDIEAACEDFDHDSCAAWASQGECEVNSIWMHENCGMSCGVCEPPCADDNEKCRVWASQGECKENPSFMLESCKLSCYVCSADTWTEEELFTGDDLGEEQHVEGDADAKVSAEAVQAIIVKARTYMTTTVREKFNYGMDEVCTNKHEHCALWAVLGECEQNAEYMKSNCGPVCQSCEVHTLQYRCPVDPDAPVAWQPGDLNKMFEKLTSEPYVTDYSVEILSSPNKTQGPWVITMENIVSEEEAKRMIELGGDVGYERSADVGALRADGTWEDYFYDGRTSKTAWCGNECGKDPLAAAVINRMSDLTGINSTNSEFPQLLKYEVGQFYNVHHDYIAASRDRQDGPRILTMYLYLNDVEAGGGTNFDKLNVTVMPKRGRAVLWPSVFDDKPLDKDERTTHQALPVEAGRKYGANAWFHLRDFKAAQRKNCN